MALFILAFTFEMLEVFSHTYLKTGYHHMVEGLLNGPLNVSFWLWQVKICSLVPLVLLGLLCLFRMRNSLYTFLAGTVSPMRWQP